MPPAKRFLESLPAAALAVTRLCLHRDPFDWLVVLAAFWALLPFCTQPRARHVVLSLAALSLSAIYLKSQVIHMLAVTSLLP